MNYPYMVEFYTANGNPGRIRLPSVERVATFITHSLILGDTITKIERVQ